jgi:hypothetical protein
VSTATHTHAQVGRQARHRSGTGSSGWGGHDHAWTSLEPGADDVLLIGRYRCTLCSVVWEL